MSSTAMLEPFDTPMFDYNEDSDIAMGGENWFHPPSRMEEDGHGAQDTSVIPDISIRQEGGLEVDMMAYDETAEYDMADGEGEHEVDTELVDTEVLDASVVPSPAPIPIPQLDIDSSTKVYAEPVARPEPVDDSVTNDLQQIVPQEQEIETVVNDSANEDSAQSGGDHGLAGPQEIAATAQMPDGAAIDLITPRVDPTTTDGHDSESHNAPLQQEESANHEAAPAENVEETYDDRNLHPEGPTETVRTPELPEEPLVNESLEAQEPPTAVEISTYSENEAHDDLSSLVAPNRLGAITSSPPVLFSLRLGGEQHEFALFSSPTTEPVKVAVADGDEEGNPEETIVLLYHRPELFYQPISSVFDAVRQEEYFSHFEELAEAEMVLNAHDLELVISEDNIFAREVSLHDLNAIHDGVGLTGPLRVTLQSSPRFVTRYNFLRDQMSRVIISAEGVEDEPGAAEPVDEEQDNTENPAVVEEVANNDDTVAEVKGDAENLEHVEADQGPTDIDHVTSHDEQVEDEDANTHADHDEGQPAEDEQSTILAHELEEQESPEHDNKGTVEPATEPTNDHPEEDDFDDFGSEDAIGEDDWLEYDETSEVPENPPGVSRELDATDNDVDGNASFAVSTGLESLEESHGEVDHGSTESTLESDEDAFEDFDEVDAADSGLSVEHSEIEGKDVSSHPSESTTDKYSQAEKSPHPRKVNEVSADLNNSDNSGAPAVGDNSIPKDIPVNVVETVDDFSDNEHDSEWTQQILDNPEERQASPHDQTATDHTTTDRNGNHQLSKSSSKRSLDLAELDDDDDGTSPPHSPGVAASKRSRVE